MSLTINRIIDVKKQILQISQCVPVLSLVQVQAYCKVFMPFGPQVPEFIQGLLWHTATGKEHDI